MKGKRKKAAKVVPQYATQPQLRPVVGVAWYRADQWPRFRAVAADKDALHSTYAEWEQAATVKLHELRDLGIDARPVMVDVEEFVQWCQERNIALDGSARSSFVAEKIRRE